MLVVIEWNSTSFVAACYDNLSRRTSTVKTYYTESVECLYHVYRSRSMCMQLSLLVETRVDLPVYLYSRYNLNLHAVGSCSDSCGEAAASLPRDGIAERKQ